MSRSLREALYPRGYRGKYVMQPWLAWGRVARPYSCRRCGRSYAPALTPEIDDRRAVYLRPLSEAERRQRRGLGDGVRLWVFARTNAYRYCRDPDCVHFYNYEIGDARRRRPAPGDAFVPVPWNPMRKRWGPMPRAANSRHYIGRLSAAPPEQVAAVLRRCVPQCPPWAAVEEPC